MLSSIWTSVSYPQHPSLKTGHRDLMHGLFMDEELVEWPHPVVNIPVSR